MRTEDLRPLGMRLTQLAEAFDRKSPSQNALLVWLDVLKEFPLFEVESMLVDMPKRLTKFPAPADVWKACNERRSDRIENEARIHRLEQTPSVTSFVPNSAVGRRELAKIKVILSHSRPSKQAWIDQIQQRHEDGDEKLSGYAVNVCQRGVSCGRAAYEHGGTYAPRMAPDASELARACAAARARVASCRDPLGAMAESIAGRNCAGCLPCRNGEKREKKTAALLVSHGVKPGVPDLILPVPRGPYIGLAIEMKRVRGKGPTELQQIWLDGLAMQGWRTHACYGATEAIDVISRYMSYERMS